MLRNVSVAKHCCWCFSFSLLCVFLSVCLSPALPLSNPSNPHPGEQCVLVLVMLCRHHSVWGLWNIHADTHTHTHTPQDTHRHKHFQTSDLFVYIHSRLENIIYLAAGLGRKIFTHMQTHMHTLHSKGRRLHSSSQSSEFLQNTVWYLLHIFSVCIEMIMLIKCASRESSMYT